jgi:hypothetical protein
MGMEGSVFWDVAACRPLEVTAHFGAACAFHIRLENESSKEVA